MPNSSAALKSKIVTHKRYISDIADNCVIIDTKSEGAVDNLMTEIDLDAIYFHAGNKGQVYSGICKMSDFEHITLTAKAVINEILKSESKSSLSKQQAGTIVFFISRLYAWMFRNSIYRLDQLAKEDVRAFINDLKENIGWWGMLEAENCLDKLEKDIDENNGLLKEIITIEEKHNQRIHVNIKGLNKLTGYFFGPSNIPADRIRKIASKYYPDKQTYKAAGYIQPSGLSKDYYRNILESFNKLYNLPKGIDQVKFCPFPKPSKLAKELASKHTDERTENVTPEDAAKLLATSIDWVYVKSNGILELIETARNQSAKDVARTNIRKAVNEKYQEIKEEYGFEYKSIGVDSYGNHEMNLKIMVKTLLTSCFMLVGINHGRRKNELIGESDLPYGLYYGCTERIDGQIDLFNIDIYVEKTIQDWLEFYCNKLVYDAVQVLCKIYEKHQSITSSGIPENETQDEQRKRKLFKLRNYSNKAAWEDTNVSDYLESYNFKNHSVHFFEIAKVEKKKIEYKSHTNRRLFSTVYYYRFDHKDLLALSQHLVHLGLSMTKVYVEDPGNREYAERLETLWSYEEEACLPVDEEVRDEYFKHSIEMILKGVNTGGNFPRIVTRLASLLSNDIKFKKMSLESKADALSGRLKEHGYSPNPKDNSCCMATPESRLRKYSNCYDEKEECLNRQDASVGMCHGCVHQYETEGNYQVIEEEIKELEDTSKNKRLPIYVRKQADDEANEMKLMLEKDKQLSARNKQYIISVIKKIGLEG